MAPSKSSSPSNCIQPLDYQKTDATEPVGEELTAKLREGAWGERRNDAVIGSVRERATIGRKCRHCVKEDVGGLF
jgi:hypothetical protein